MKKNIALLVCALVLLGSIINNLYSSTGDTKNAQVDRVSITHLAIIMDGNRRWAQRRLLPPWKGHDVGVEAVERTVEFCIKNRIKYLSLYTFSLENFNRSPAEIHYLFEIIDDQMQKWLPKLIQNGVRVCFIGNRQLFPASLKQTIDNVEQQTKSLTNLQLNFLFCYGGQQDITHACKEIAQKVATGILDIDQINDQLVGEHLWTTTMPMPELIIRTGGHKRLSNFLLFQAAYSELYFMDRLWPDIQEYDLQDAVNYFEEVTRNFGA